MKLTPAVRMLLAGFLVLVGSVNYVLAQAPSPAQMLDAKLAPKSDDLNITIPTDAELRGCTVELVNGAGKSSGWLLKDAKGQPVRRFFDSKGAGSVDMWSYYKDGVEVYREFDTAYKGAPNNFRWLNQGGMKWGVGYVSNRGKAVITAWRMLSAEEAAFEAFQAAASHDPSRLQALLITENEMQMLKLPAAKIKAVLVAQQQAAKKFDDFVKETKLAGVKFDGVEPAIPHCDTTGDVETIRHPSRAIRYVGDKQHGWIYTSEMIQVGMAWRMVDVPMSKDPVGLAIGGPAVVQPQPGNEKLDKLQKELAILDENPPPPAGVFTNNAKVDAYYRKRIEIVQQILPLDKATEREGWYKQLFDNLAAMAQNSGNKGTIATLNQLKNDVVKQLPGSNLAAYGTYRAMWTDYALGTSASPPPPQAEILKIQQKWLDDLADFVKQYPKSEDAPEALMHHALGCEFNGKIEEAKRSYQMLVDGFPKHAQLQRAQGSLARLNLIGSEMKLAAPLLADSSKVFNLETLKGKVIVVHYWGSYSEQYRADFAHLKSLLAAAKDVELVSINLDPDASTAKAAVAKAQAPGIHLFQADNNASGLSSPLATQYGIHILPTVFVIGRNGRVTNNAVQIGDLETELKKVQ